MQMEVRECACGQKFKVLKSSPQTRHRANCPGVTTRGEAKIAKRRAYDSFRYGAKKLKAALKKANKP